jgi:hypothetical protein
MEGEGGSGGRFRNLRDISVVMGIVIVKLGTERRLDWEFGRMLDWWRKAGGRLGGCFDSRKTCGLGIEGMTGKVEAVVSSVVR